MLCDAGVVERPMMVCIRVEICMGVFVGQDRRCGRVRKRLGARWVALIPLRAAYCCTPCCAGR